MRDALVGIVAVAVGGAIGALLRYGITAGAALMLARSSAPLFPVGTLLVNVVGCFALAWLVAAGERTGLVPGLRLFLGTGVIGALTTFSTFGVDAHGLILQGRSGAAVLYLGATLLLAGIAVLLGWAIGR